VYSQIKSAFVGNLPEDVNEEYLRKLFEQFGEVGAPRCLSHFLQFRLTNITCNVMSEDPVGPPPLFSSL